MGENWEYSDVAFRLRTSAQIKGSKEVNNQIFYSSLAGSRVRQGGMCKWVETG